MKDFFRLVLWEIEENWRFPSLEIIAAILMYFSLTSRSFGIPKTYNQVLSYSVNVVYSFWLLMFEVVFIAVFFSRSVAEQIEKREILTLFAHPPKRTTVLLAKFLTNMLVILLVISASVIIYGLFIGLGPLHPVHYITILVAFLQLLFFSAISLACSVFSKSSWASIIIPIVTLFALMFIAPQDQANSYISPLGSIATVYRYLISQLIPIESYTFGTPPSTATFIGAVLFPVTISAFLLTLSFIYFRKMEVD
jgi:ABC-type transport system involved in multi-copper enzyme maturation permease subunit